MCTFDVTFVHALPNHMISLPMAIQSVIIFQEPRHKNGIILGYQVYGRNIRRIPLPWYKRRFIIPLLKTNQVYEAKLRARTSSGWGIPVFRWFQTHNKTGSYCACSQSFGNDQRHSLNHKLGVLPFLKCKLSFFSCCTLG